MNKNIRNILREKLLRVSIKKQELFLNIIKSIRQNNTINNNIKNYTNLYLKKLVQNKAFFCKHNKVCFYTGKRGGVLKNLNLSRHTTKLLIIQNRLTNIKKHNW